MHLSRWLEKESQTPANFAKSIGVPASTIYRIIRDGRAPTHQVMERIVRGTRGGVLPNDFFDIAKLSETPR